MLAKSEAPEVFRTPGAVHRDDRTEDAMHPNNDMPEPSPRGFTVPDSPERPGPLGDCSCGAPATVPTFASEGGVCDRCDAHRDYAAMLLGALIRGAHQRSSVTLRGHLPPTWVTSSTAKKPATRWT